MRRISLFLFALAALPAAAHDHGCWHRPGPRRVYVEREWVERDWCRRPLPPRAWVRDGWRSCPPPVVYAEPGPICAPVPHFRVELNFR